jgi:hypothetical protein
VTLKRSKGQINKPYLHIKINNPRIQLNHIPHQMVFHGAYLDNERQKSPILKKLVVTDFKQKVVCLLFCIDATHGL